MNTIKTVFALILLVPVLANAKLEITKRPLSMKDLYLEDLINMCGRHTGIASASPIFGDKETWQRLYPKMAPMDIRVRIPSLVSRAAKAKAEMIFKEGKKNRDLVRYSFSSNKALFKNNYEEIMFSDKIAERAKSSISDQQAQLKKSYAYVSSKALADLDAFMKSDLAGIIKKTPSLHLTYTSKQGLEICETWWERDRKGLSWPSKEDERLGSNNRTRGKKWW